MTPEHWENFLQAHVAESKALTSVQQVSRIVLGTVAALVLVFLGAVAAQVIVP